MLTISQSQFDALNDAAEERFQARLVDVVVHAWPLAAAQLRDPAARKKLDELVMKGREQAAKLRIEADADVGVIAGFMIANAHFSKEEAAQFRAWVMPFLERESLTGKARLAFAERILRSKAARHSLAARLCAMIESVRAGFSVAAV